LEPRPAALKDRHPWHHGRLTGSIALFRETTITCGISRGMVDVEVNGIDLGAPRGGLRDSPGAVSWGPNRIDCFVRGTNDHLWHKWWDGRRWSDWEDLGAPPNGVRSSPAAVSWGHNRIDCFVRGSNDRLWHKWWS
jgi:hypothetical protein